jgi:hypothetical protein
VSSHTKCVQSHRDLLAFYFVRFEDRFTGARRRLEALLVPEKRSYIDNWNLFCHYALLHTQLAYKTDEEVNGSCARFSCRSECLQQLLRAVGKAVSNVGACFTSMQAPLWPASRLDQRWRSSQTSPTPPVQHLLHAVARRFDKRWHSPRIITSASTHHCCVP